MSHVLKSAPSNRLPKSGARAVRARITLGSGGSRKLALHDRRRNRARIDPMNFGSWFSTAFPAYLQKHYRTYHDVADVFGVSHSTAHRWWIGEVTPGGGHVGYAVMTDPSAMAFFKSAYQAESAQ